MGDTTPVQCEPTYLNNCLQGVKQSDMGVKVDDLSVNCLLYADDAVLIASSECELHVLITTLREGPSIRKK